MLILLGIGLALLSGALGFLATELFVRILLNVHSTLVWMACFVVLSFCFLAIFRMLFGNLIRRLTTPKVRRLFLSAAPAAPACGAPTYKKGTKGYRSTSMRDERRWEQQRAGRESHGGPAWLRE